MAYINLSRSIEKAVSNAIVECDPVVMFAKSTLQSLDVEQQSLDFWILVNIGLLSISEDEMTMKISEEFGELYLGRAVGEYIVHRAYFIVFKVASGGLDAESILNQAEAAVYPHKKKTQ